MIIVNLKFGTHIVAAYEHSLTKQLTKNDDRKTSMPAPKGNAFWKARSSHGRQPIFADASQLWDACVEYFEWVEQHPLYEAKAFAYKGRVELKRVPKMRAMTISGLCIFLDMTLQTWTQYRARQGFADITQRVDEIIRTQKFEGAAAGLLDANLIAREMAMLERPGSGDPYEQMSDEELTEELIRIFDESGMTLVPWEPVTPQKLIAQQSEVDAPT